MGHSARNTAMDLLSRRDHSRKQLSDKLQQRGFEADEIAVALDKLQQEHLLNDARFCESYLHQRVQRGYGPLRIRQELAQRGVSAEVIALCMESSEDGWVECMQIQREKKFGKDMPEDYKEMTKQARFLQNRGFSPEAVMRLFRR